MTHKAVGEGAYRPATVVVACAVSADQQERSSRGEEELVDAKLVVTTVAQAEAACGDVRDLGLDDVVVWGRCARCGREGRVVHFDGALRARAQAP